MVFLYLTGGLFLGWSLGANDAANIFGTAVGTKMISFRKAAVIASVFVILGAVLEGSGASQTIDSLGSVDDWSKAFVISFASALTVTLMTRFSLPVSTSQAIIGAIIGWNIFAGQATDMKLLGNILLTWLLCPLLAALFALIIYLPVKRIVENSKIHLLRLDAYTRLSLTIAGAIGAYSLGANNIANVVGVFISSTPLQDLSFGFVSVSASRQLLFLGSLAIATGIITYSYRVMRTVGSDLFHLSPVTALIVVISHSLVLYIFASEGLRGLLISLHLPPVPLVPVSSSQAVVGAILGIAIAKRSSNIKFSVLARIASGWVTTPLAAGMVSWTIFRMLGFN